MPSNDAPALQRIRQDKAVHYDLTAPRTAQELGIPADRDSAIFDRDGSDYWTVTITLPQGRTFSTSTAIAVGLMVPEYFAGSASKSRVGINARAADADDLEVQLQAAVEQLSVDAGQVSAFLAQVREQPLTTTNPTRNSVFDGRPVGHLTTSVEARLEEGRDSIALNYSFSWVPDPPDTPPPSPKP